MENLGFEMDSQQLNDEQLCQLVSQGQREAEEVLVIRYTRLVRSCARPFFLVGGDSEDLTQEGMVGLLRAIREFDGSRETTFRTFAEVCIRNRLLSALRWASRDKHAPLNQSIPLDTPFFEDHSYKASTTQSHGNPEDLYIDQEGAKDLMAQVQKQLSELESKILGFYLDGLSYMEIAATVGKTPKSVDNAVQRIRRKVAQQLTQSDLSGN